MRNTCSARPKLHQQPNSIVETRKRGDSWDGIKGPGLLLMSLGELNYNSGGTEASLRFQPGPGRLVSPRVYQNKVQRKALLSLPKNQLTRLGRMGWDTCRLQNFDCCRL